jgi:hypothetical protein
VEKRNGCEIQPAQVRGRPKSAVLLYVSTVHHLECGLWIYCDLSSRMVGIVHLTVLMPILVTNAVFVDAERDGEQWLKEWNEERSRYRVFTNRLKAKNLVRWNQNSEA